MKNKSKNSEDSWNDLFKALPQYAPRTGYAQRFWARAEAAVPVSGYWRWLPVMATALGLTIGIVLAGQISWPPIGQTALDTTANLPEGSLAATLSMKVGK